MPVRFERLNPEPIPETIPDLRLASASLPSGLIIARFLEHSQARRIPSEAELVEIRPSAKFPVQSEFILPVMLPSDRPGGFIMSFASGQPVECRDGRILSISNLTTRTHLVKGERINGVGGIVHLRGIGASVKLQAVDGLWIITGAYNAELKG